VDKLATEAAAVAALRAREAIVCSDVERLQQANRSMTNELKNASAARARLEASLATAADALTTKTNRYSPSSCSAETDAEGDYLSLTACGCIAVRFEMCERARLAAAEELDAMRSMFGGDLLDAAAVEVMFGLKWEKQGPGVHIFRHAGGFTFELSSGGEEPSVPVEVSPAPSNATEVVYRPLDVGNQQAALPARLVDVESVTFETRLLPKFFSQLLNALNQ